MTEDNVHSNSAISLSYQFPSKGLLYDGNLPEGRATIFPLLGEHEEMIAGMGEGKNAGPMWRQVTKQLIQLPSTFDFLDLTVNDWTAAILNILAFSFTPVFTLEPRCPHCHKNTVVSKNISEFEITTPEDIVRQKFGISEEEDVSSDLLLKYKEPFITQPLPFSKDVVKFRILRLRDIERIEQYERQLDKKSNISAGRVNTYTLAQHIVEINGTDFSQATDMAIMNWIRKSRSGDLQVLRDTLKNTEVGYEIQPSFTCGFCEESFKVMLPLTDTSFFFTVRAGIGINP